MAPPTAPRAADAAAWLRQATALLEQRRAVAAAQLLDAAPARAIAAPAWALLRGVAHARLGQIDRAIERLLPLRRGPAPWAAEATAALADAYHLAQRHAELRELLAAGAAWSATPRGALFEARLLVDGDPEQALAKLLDLVDTRATDELRRIAGFDAVRLLDRLGRYREAFALATRLHAAAGPFDLDDFLAGVRMQQRLLAKGASWCSARTAPVGDVAFVVGLPRSGTTLLEQMLDRHPAVTGIGEHEGIGDVAEALLGEGVWPYRLNHLTADAAARIQQAYRRGARQRLVADAGADTDVVWTLDKSLVTWRWLPALAAVLPGAVALHVVREPRDMAISAFLSYFDPQSFGWTGSLATIRQVIAAERALVPLVLRTLDVPHEAVVYERLVADPRGTLERCLARLGLPLDERVLSPEHNPRTAVTLSHAQVRRPVNDASIGRWQRYDWAFDEAWNALSNA